MISMSPSSELWKLKFILGTPKLATGVRSEGDLGIPKCCS